MAKVFVSYNRRDRDLVLEVAQALKARGHEITVDVDTLAPGQNWQKTLTEGLKASDVFVVFLSESSLGSQFVLSEVGAARAYSEQSDRMLLVPVLIDEIRIPPIIQDLFVIQASDRNAQDITQRIEAAIAAFFGRRAAKEQQDTALSERIEANAAEYIEDAVAALGKLETRNRLLGLAWYVAGFLALVLGILFAVVGVAVVAASAERSWLDFALLALKSVVVVGLLGGCANERE